MKECKKGSARFIENKLKKFTTIIMDQDMPDFEDKGFIRLKITHCYEFVRTQAKKLLDDWTANLKLSAKTSIEEIQKLIEDR